MKINTRPPLENGDRLNRFEFERRYQLMVTPKKQVKAELIDGVVHMAAALRYKSHGLPHSLVMTWLGFYVANTSGLELADNATVILDIDNEAQPDALLRIKSELGGQSYINDDDYIVGAPELIFEIAASTASYDLHDKLNVYRRHGVKEYIVWQVYDQEIVWFYLEQGEYLRLEPDNLGLIESKNFPSLILDVHSLLENDLATVLSKLQEKLNSEKHQNFIQELNKKIT